MTRDYGGALACPTGIEPVTPSLEGWCSIRLSYGHDSSGHDSRYLVGVERFELPTSCSQSRHATRLRYTPEGRNYTYQGVKGQFEGAIAGAVPPRINISCTPLLFLILKRTFPDQNNPEPVKNGFRIPYQLQAVRAEKGRAVHEPEAARALQENPQPAQTRVVAGYRSHG